MQRSDIDIIHILHLEIQVHMSNELCGCENVLDCVIYRRKKQISEDLFTHVGILFYSILFYSILFYSYPDVKKEDYIWKSQFHMHHFFFHTLKFYLRIRIIYVWFHMACFVSLFLSFLKCFTHMWIKVSYNLTLFSSYMLFSLVHFSLVEKAILHVKSMWN